MNGTVATARNSATQNESEDPPITIKQMTRNNSVNNQLVRRRESRLIQAASPSSLDTTSPLLSIVSC